jgi:UDP-N-acetylglucosamine:LPS N-acetylglucosamine transferase
VAILTADVGEGHVAAANALASELSALDRDAEIVVIDVLAAFGRTLRLVLRDGYRLQLRRAPWLFGLIFALALRVRVARRIGRAGLTLLGGRGLARALAEARPDIVVSTYPAATSVLGALRLRGRVTVPVYATITDLAGAAFWAHPGIDLHLVMHAAVVDEVEREAGAGSARAIRPLVGEKFDLRPARADARAALELPLEERVVVVSGGGWAVGDLVGAVETAREDASTNVICLAGRDEKVRAKLESEFCDDRRVRVLPFTDRMPELLSAADVLIHSTGGVTLLEALACDCPVIAFGVPRGHGPALARAAAGLGLAAHARTRDDLRRALVTPPQVSGADAASLTAGAALLAAPTRAIARRQPRRRLVPALAVSCALGAFVLGSSEAAFAVVDGPFDLKPLAAIPTAKPWVGVVVEAPQPEIPALARVIRADGASASFAFHRLPDPATLRMLSADGDGVIVALRPAGVDDWLGTLDQLRDSRKRDARRGALFALAPATGLSAGQYLLARAAGARLVADTHATSVGLVSSERLVPGQVVVAAADTSALRRLLRLIAKQRLRASSLQALEQAS